MANLRYKIGLTSQTRICKNLNRTALKELRKDKILQSLIGRTQISEENNFSKTFSESNKINCKINVKAKLKITSNRNLGFKAP